MGCPLFVGARQERLCVGRLTCFAVRVGAYMRSKTDCLGELVWSALLWSRQRAWYIDTDTSSSTTSAVEGQLSQKRSKEATATHLGGTHLSLHVTPETHAALAEKAQPDRATHDLREPSSEISLPNAWGVEENLIGRKIEASLKPRPPRPMAALSRIMKRSKKRRVWLPPDVKPAKNSERLKTREEIASLGAYP